MHDPMVVALVIRRPWPKRGYSVSDYTSKIQFRYSWAKWWDLRPSSFRAFWRVGRVELYWPSLITIWHVEPGGHDAFTICKHKSRWKWHLWHWKIQIHPLQRLRRWALTRCEWCGGRSRKGDYVDTTNHWGREPGKWWIGERNLFHSDCLSVKQAHNTCLCGIGPFEHSNYGNCATCGKFRVWRPAEEDRKLADEAMRLYAVLSTGERPSPARREQVRALWAQHEEASLRG